MNLTPATRAIADRFIIAGTDGASLTDSLLDTSERQFRAGVTFELASHYPAVTVRIVLLDCAFRDDYEDWSADVLITQGAKIIGGHKSPFDMQFHGDDKDAAIDEACEATANMLSEAFPVLPGGCERCGMLTVGGADDRERDAEILRTGAIARAAAKEVMVNA